MDLIQKEMDEAKEIWNTYLIRKQQMVINGILNELYYLPEIRGFSCTDPAWMIKYMIKNSFLFSGYCDCSYTFDKNDIALCKSHAAEKPGLPSKFLVLMDILTREENLHTPTTPKEALTLYFTLLDLIKYWAPPLLIWNYFQKTL